MTDDRVEDALDRSELLALTSEIVSSHVSNNSVNQTDLASMIENVFTTLEGLSGPKEEPVVELKPAVSIKKSVTDEYLICLEDGKKLKMLKRHLSTSYDMTPDDYRKKWGLASDYPMVAPAYARKRQELAKKIGLVLDVFDDEALMDNVLEVAAKIAGGAPISVRLIKRLVYQNLSMDLRSSLDMVSSHMTLARMSEDHVEAIAAWREKRPGVFKGA